MLEFEEKYFDVTKSMFRVLKNIVIMMEQMGNLSRQLKTKNTEI